MMTCASFKCAFIKFFKQLFFSSFTKEATNVYFNHIHSILWDYMMMMAKP